MGSLVVDSGVRGAWDALFEPKKSFDVCREGGPNPAEPAATVSSSRDHERGEPPLDYTHVCTEI